MEIIYDHTTHRAGCRVTQTGQTIDAIGRTINEFVALAGGTHGRENSTSTEKDEEMGSISDLFILLCGAPGAARTASTRNRTRCELLVSATVDVARRRRRAGGGAS
ncbi:hypothetical protein [Alloactinosynnema sp. L-07]|uniref:hypothetical protein n=1 Tax=Alloactinosynnema sp. L-07 TaxID=1653480 RepID=UPI0012FB3105|nr:hypothetical protein [Alloactinosynnema sp. L-07]